MRDVVLAELRHNARRALGAALAIGIAVGFVVVSLGAASSMQDYILRTTAGYVTVGDAVLEPAEGAERLTEQDLATVAGLPGVASAYGAPTAGLRAGWADGEGELVAQASPPQLLRWYALQQGREPAAANEIVVEGKTARDAGLRIGSTVAATVRDENGRPAGTVTLTVVGIAPYSALAMAGSRQVLATAADVRAWGGRDLAPQVTVAAQPGTDPDTVRAVLERAVPGARVTTTAAATADRAGESGIVLAAFLLMFTAVAMVVAVIVISNTFTIVLAQRTAQLALVRCLGGTRRQVYRSVLLEALAVGAVASAVGALAGVGVLAGGVAAVRGAFIEADGLRVVLSPVAVGVAVLVGIVVTLVAAWLPARRATRIAPLAALRPDTVEQARRTSRVRIVLGLVVTGTGGALLTLLAARTTGAPPPGAQGRGGAGDPVLLLAGIGCGLLVVLGVLLSGPVVVPAVARLLGRALDGFGPVGRLAVTSTVRNPGRAAATSVALFVGVCLITLMSVGAATTTAAVSADVSRQFPVDVSVVGAPPDSVTANGGASTDPSAAADPMAVAGSRPLPPAAVSAVAAVPGVTASATLRGATVTVDGGRRVVLTGDPATLRAVVRTPIDVRPGTMVVPGLSSDPGAAPVTLKGSAGSVEVTQVRLPVPVTLVAPSDFARLTGGTGEVATAAVLLRTRDDVDPHAVLTGVQRALAGAGVSAGEEFAAYEGKASIGGSLGARATIDQAMTILLSIATGLLGVALLISLVGIGNTMALSVLERRREIGVLRALGLTRVQLRRSLTLEAVLLAAVGTVLGLVLGAGFGYAGARLMLNQLVEVGPIGIPWDRIAIVVAIALGAAVLAAVLPGRRAGRVAPTEALAAT